MLDSPILQKRNKPKVTVVTVVHNAEKYIEKTLQSVICQRYSNIEYIVVDGKSNDGTLKIVEKYRERIGKMISEKDAGIYDAMNKAIDIASGEWIIFMNAGDVFSGDDVLEWVFKEEIPEDFVYGDHTWINIGNGREHYIKSRPLEKMWQKISFSHQSLLSRLNIMKQHKFDLNYSVVSDYEFYFSHYVRGHKFKRVPFSISKVASGGVSDRLLLKRTFERWSVVRKYDKSIKKDLWYLKFLFSEIFLQLLKKKVYSYRLNKKAVWPQPLVSVIISNYNNEQYLTDCINSVLSQTYGNLEIIIVDDASTDRSIELIKEFMKQNPSIRLIKNEKNIGIQNVRNLGIREAQGEYVTTLDSDDIFYSNEKIQEEMKTIQSHHNKEVIAFSDIMILDVDSRPKTKMSRHTSIREGNIFKQIFTRSCFIPRDFLLKKSMCVDVGGYDPNIPIYEDWDLKIRLSKEYPFYYSGLVGTGYRRHGTGLSSAPGPYHKKYMNTIVEKNAPLIKELEREKLVRKAIDTIDKMVAE